MLLLEQQLHYQLVQTGLALVRFRVVLISLVAGLIGLFSIYLINNRIESQAIVRLEAQPHALWQRDLRRWNCVGVWSEANGLDGYALRVEGAG